MRRQDNSQNNQEIGNGKTIPMPKETKQIILRSRERCKQRLAAFQKNRTLSNFNQFRSSLSGYFQDLYPIALKNIDLESYEIDIQELRNPSPLPPDHEKVEGDYIDRFIDYFYEVDKITHDLGVTDISVSQDKEKFGFVLSDQIGATGIDKKRNLSVDVEDSNLGWIRLQLEFQNLRKALRQDRDAVGVVFGDNRMGKSTLALQIARIVNNGENKGNLPRESIAMGNEGFWKGLQELDKYSAIHLDELSGVFYSKDSMTSEQKKRKKRMKTAAKKNQFVIGCDTQYFQIDKEFRTDKVDFAIHVSSRGNFEFYGPKLIERFEKDKDTGRAITPSPLFSGSFPELDDELWNRYQEVEDEKLEMKDLQDDEEEGKDLEDVAEEVKASSEDFTKTYNSRKFVDSDLIEARKDVSSREADKLKKLVESDLGLPEKLD